MTKADLLVFIKKNIHAVISTCGADGQPEAALVGFGETENLELIFGTSKVSRKYKNLKKNGKVAFVIGWDDDNVTVQYQGIAAEIFDSELEKYVAIYHQKVPGAAAFKSLPDQTYFKVIPKWIRYTQISDKQEIFEMSF